MVPRGVVRFQQSPTEEPTVNPAEGRATSPEDLCLPDNPLQVCRANMFPSSLLTCRTKVKTLLKTFFKVLIVWLFVIELHGAEEAPDCPGLAGEEVLGTLVELEEVEEDLRGANSVVGEEAEVGGAGMCDPSPGELTWLKTSASSDWKWTNQMGCLPSPWKHAYVML